MPNLPKPADRRVRRNRGGIEFRSVELTPGAQPDLPERDLGWSDETVEFWKSLGLLELSREFTPVEWNLLKLAALIHEEVWVEGKTIRLDQFFTILGRFPFTPKDRQALRIQMLTGDQLETKVDSVKERKKSGAKAQYQGLKAI